MSRSFSTGPRWLPIGLRSYGRATATSWLVRCPLRSGDLGGSLVCGGGIEVEDSDPGTLGGQPLRDGQANT